MIAFLLLPILISGFVLCQKHPILRYKLHRYEGQFLYLKCVQYGLYCSIFSCLFLFYTKYLPFGHINDKLYNISFLQYDFNALHQASYCFLFTILVLIIPYVWSWFSFLRLMILYRTTSVIYVKRCIINKLLQDSPLDNFLFKASINRDVIVMLTLSDGKVYVGNILSLGEPNETQGADQEVKILPYMSGYRNKTDLTVHFTTDYKVVSEKITLVLIQKNIISVTKFSFEHYDKFLEVQKNDIDQDVKENSEIKKIIAIATSENQAATNPL